MLVTEMKFSVEREWIKSVRSAENKPNYGMENIANKTDCWGKSLAINWSLLGHCLMAI
ncbi:Hypothetical predicted protein [Paramuricea clavata]|uniref:Uncharacterized protein n=1 Tax=Paramuricea clavata TaxID=317549 RepID=A0A6S7GRQ1_PARCT|nr:Hypothetical predicted protein [Paramuricea clavata]